MTTDTTAQLGTAEILWDLRALYPSADAPEIRRDLDRCHATAVELAAGFAGRVAELDAAALHRLVGDLEEVDCLLARLEAFAFLHFITQTGDAAASALLQQVEELAARVGRQAVFFALEWNRLDPARAEHLLGQPELERYRHYLRALRQFAPHQLSSAEEELLQELRPVGRSAWNLLFDKLFGHLRFGVDGRTEEEVLSDLHHPDRAVRRRGADELTAGLRENLHLLTHIFNTLAAEKMIDDRLRRYP
ncbi:MAG: oligoendopeptidase F, partial [Desulfobulbus sp.]|nr:oligoendopeptidase F [Desulfobulbus sp.]